MENPGSERKGILPIVTYGHSTLRKKCEQINESYLAATRLPQCLWSTMNHADGVGLAAPQINKAKNLFAVNSAEMYRITTKTFRASHFAGDKGIEETFVNARIIAESEEQWEDTEGCLSVPGIFEQVKRPWEIMVEYYDCDFNFHRKHFAGYTARVIQHEYDHLNGKLFIDRLSVLNKKLIQSKLRKINRGKIDTTYPTLTT